MTAALLLDSIFAWSAQVALLVAVGALAGLTLTHPRGRLIFWQGILAIALLLPAVEPWHQPAAENTGLVSIATSAAQVIVNRPPAWRFAWKREYLLLLIAAGASLRFLWIAAGLIRLRRHRLDARMLTTPPVPFSNPRVRWFISTTVGGPVTFGFLSPTILLPARVAELAADLREAIAHHELAHVRRRDWLFVLLEESIRSVLWFHPGVWFVLSRIQLAREQVVDAEVVGLTRDRERYLDALVAVAAHRLLPDVAPAPLFLKKRQLAVRVAAVLKEPQMSKPRTFLSFATVCSAALIAVRVAVWMFPMQAPAQTAVSQAAVRSIPADGPGVVVEPGGRILHRPPVFFPSGVTTTGTVMVATTVNSKGEVTDARVISGPEEFRSAVLSSVLSWHFSTDGGLPPTFDNTIRFETAPPVATVASAPVPSGAYQSVKSIMMNGLPDDLAEKVRQGLPVHVGDAFSTDDFARVRAAVKEIDEHLVAILRTNGSDVWLTIMLRPSGLTGGITGGVSGGAAGGVNGGVPGVLIDEGSIASPALAQIPPPASGVQRVRVGGNVESANLIKKVTPLYPPLAKQARIQGIVRFTALIGADGYVASLQLLEGHPLLVESAREAVAQWQYKPTLLNGNAVEVITQIDVNYTLTQ
jgi:beta-lactamase regulating signal transducer with metallopeptidase domain